MTRLALANARRAAEKAWRLADTEIERGMQVLTQEFESELLSTLLNDMHEFINTTCKYENVVQSSHNYDPDGKCRGVLFYRTGIHYPLVSQMHAAALVIDRLATLLSDVWQERGGQSYEECACVLPEQSCTACRETAWKIYQEDMT